MARSPKLRAMPALLDTAPPPSPPPVGSKAAAAPPKTAHALAPGQEQFIPVSRYGLRAQLVSMLAESGGDRRAWARALDCLAAWRHQEHRKRLLDLLENYLPFSPDSDTANLVELDEAGRDKAPRDFIDGMESLLIQANYVRLSADDVKRLLIERSPYGLHLNVDLSDFDDVLLYFRGTALETREERNPWRLYLVKDRFEIPLFERLFLLLKLKPTERAPPRSRQQLVSIMRGRCAWRGSGESTCPSAFQAGSFTSKCSNASPRSIWKCCSPTRGSTSSPSTS